MHLTAPLVSPRDASRAPIFWALFLTFFVRGLSTKGLIQTHWITPCADFGVAPVGAAGILAVIGVFDLAGTVLSGRLIDTATHGSTTPLQFDKIVIPAGQ